MSQKEAKQMPEFDENLFRERFIELREDYDMKQAEFADFLGIPTGSVGGYESGKKFPNGKTLFKISKKCNISADYLLGISDVKSIDMKPKAIKNYTGLSEKAINRLHKSFADRTFPEYLEQEFIEKVRRIEKEVADILSELIDSDDENSLLQSVYYLQSYLKLDRDMAKKYEEKTKCENINKKEIESFLREIADNGRSQRLDYYEAIDSFKYAVDEYLKNHRLFKSEMFESLINIIDSEGEADGEYN